jgi:hypothetical protein
VKEKIKQLGMSFSLWLMNVNDGVYNIFNQDNEFFFSIYLEIELMANRIFGFFYEGSQDEYTDAVNLEFGNDLSNYTITQQAIIIANNILENSEEQ